MDALVTVVVIVPFMAIMTKEEAEDIVAALETWLEAREPTFLQEKSWASRKEYRGQTRERLVAAIRGTDLDGSELCAKCRLVRDREMR